MSDDKNTASSPLVRRLEEMRARHDSLAASLNDPDVLTQHQKVAAISKEAGRLESVVAKYRDYCKTSQSARELAEMAANRADPAMAEMAAEELPLTKAAAEKIWEELREELAAAEDNA